MEMIGLIKVLLKTLVMPKRRQKYSVKNPDDKPLWSLEELDVHDPDEDPGEEWWRSQMESFIEEKEQRKLQAEKQTIEDYESEHGEDAEKTDNPNTEREVYDLSSDDFEDDPDMDSDFDDDSENYGGYIG
jgi:hypothetical protein